MLLSQEYVSLLMFIGISIIGGMGYIYQYSIRKIGIVLISSLLGLMSFVCHPIHQEGNVLGKVGQSTQVQGRIIEVRESDYYTWLIIDHVVVGESNANIKSLVQLRLKKNQISACTVNDLIKVMGKRLEDEKQMNPSDMDYGVYLKSKNILATLAVDQVDEIIEVNTFQEKWILSLEKRIDTLFSRESSGIVRAITLGQKDAISPEIRGLYNQAGIGHILCISGFHISLMTATIFLLLGWLGCAYYSRHIISILFIWLYTLFTGAGISTVRAAIMISMLLIGHCLWQEEDGWTQISIAAVLILISTPYQLFQVGFQLSFAAIIGVQLYLSIIEYHEIQREEQINQWVKGLGGWLCIQLLTAPIIAYYFYEIPFLLALSNLLVIPIFSGIIIAVWLALAVGMIYVPLAELIAWGIDQCLLIINNALQLASNIPLATLCTGRPLWWHWILLIGIYSILIGWLQGKVLREYLNKGLAILLGIMIVGVFLQEQALTLTSLYVGQGDGTVIITPEDQVIVMDAGNFGKGEVIERYIKYRGYKKIDALIISHSDADHLGGVGELIESGIEISQIFISALDQSELLDRLLQQCREEQIEVVRLVAKDQLYFGKMRINCLAPITNQGNANDNSLVCLVEYGDFSALFTGDKSIDSESAIYGDISPVTMLKVSHHGSKTGTSKALLLNLEPMYAMISCGKNNRYGHPHDEVMTLLEGANISISRTDLHGAIYYETDGSYLKQVNYRKEI